MPVQDPVRMVRSAIHAAENHLSTIKGILAPYDGPPSSGKQQQPTGGEVFEIQCRIRSFFWELYGAYDLILQWANVVYELRLDESEVGARSVRSAQSGVSGWEKVRSILNDTWNTPWFFEVRTYRNFSHRSLLGYTALVSKERGLLSVFLPSARVGQEPYQDLREQLQVYVHEMLLVGKKLFPGGEGGE